MAKDNFIFYRQWWESIRELNPEQQSCAYDALMQFAFDGIEPSDPVIRAITSPMRTKIQRDAERYEKVCEARRQAGRKGGRPKKQKANESKQNQMKPIAFSESEPTVIETPDTPEPETLTDLEQQFDAFRQKYPGRKRGFKAEFDNFKRKNPKTWREIIPLLAPAIDRLLEWNDRAHAAGQFVPGFKNLATWLNQQCWTEELPDVKPTSTTPGTPTPKMATAADYDDDDPAFVSKNR